MDRLDFEVSKPLGIEDIFNIAKKSCNVLPYSQIHTIDNIDYLFDYNPMLTPPSNHPYDPNSCLILYLTATNYGHWCVLNRLKNTYQFLDSYGEIFDDQLQHVNETFRKSSDQNERYLTELFHDKVNKKSRTEFHYNDKQLQNLSDEIATCGRYAALFLKFNDMTVEDFVDTINNLSEIHNIDPDHLVTLLSI